MPNIDPAAAAAAATAHVLADAGLAGLPAEQRLIAAAQAGLAAAATARGREANVIAGLAAARDAEAARAQAAREQRDVDLLSGAKPVRTFKDLFDANRAARAAARKP